MHLMAVIECQKISFRINDTGGKKKNNVGKRYDYFE